MSIKVFLVDDEGPSRRELRYLLEQLEQVELVGEAPNGTLALKRMRESKPHVLFLDVQMPGMNGLEFSKLFMELPHKPLVVFATAFGEYALEAFEVDAIDYILKPFTLERVKKSIIKAEAFLSETFPRHVSGEAAPTESPPHSKKEWHGEKKILLYRNERIIPVSPGKILHVRSLNGEIFVQTREEVYKTKSTMNELENKLFPFGFLRAHRSSLVNINSVAEVIPWFHGSYKLVMNDRERNEIMVSRYNVKELKKYFEL